MDFLRFMAKCVGALLLLLFLIAFSRGFLGYLASH